MKAKKTEQVGKVGITLLNCTIEGFHTVMSSSEVLKTPSITLSLSSCGVVRCKYPFLIDQPASCVFNAFLESCYFEKCVKAISVQSNAHRVKASKCTFSYNKECFDLKDPSRLQKLETVSQLELQPGLKDSGILQEVALNSVLVSHCSFSYNEIIMKAAKYCFGIGFYNTVKYTLYKGFVLDECVQVEFVENGFEANFCPQLFESGSEEPGQTKTPEGDPGTLRKGAERARALVHKKENVLVQLNASNLNLSQNRFRKNFGILLLIIDRANLPFTTDTSKTTIQKPRSRFEESPNADQPGRAKFAKKGPTSLKDVVAQRKFKKRPDLLALQKEPSYKLEDSTVNQLNPQRLKKKVPVLNIFRRSRGSNKFQARRRKTPQTLSYLSIIEQQSTQSNFSSR